MEDAAQPKVAAVKFKWEKSDRSYDYLIPDGLAVSVGDKAVVATKRGEATVEIVGLKEASEVATAYLLRKAEPVEAPVAQAEARVEGWNF